MLDDAKCIRNCVPPGMVGDVQITLLCKIIDAIGGGISGATGVFCGDVDPVAAPGVNCALYYNRVTASLWAWNQTLGIWFALIG